MIPVEIKDVLLEACGVADIPRFKQKMEQLHALLIEANSKVNLTRITSDEGFWFKHVMDSLYIGVAHPEAFKAGMRWVDLGCGGGFPSLVLATAFPQIHITAIDSIGKKTNFVRSAGESLGLTNLMVVTGRGRELCHLKEFQGKFDILTARAVAEPSRILLEGLKMVKAKGHVILYQTPEQVQTETQGNDPCYRDGVKWVTSEIYDLPQSVGQRQFLHGTPL